MIKIVGLWIAVIWFTALHSPFGAMIAIILSRVRFDLKHAMS